MTLRIIMSAAYVDEELQAEFGRLPPVMLPLGGGVLAHHQLARFAASEKGAQEAGAPKQDGADHGWPVHVILPADFELLAQRRADLEARGARFVTLRPGLSLGAAVAEVLALLEATGPVEIMHGDTLLTPNGAARGGDCYSVADIADGYHWARVSVKGDRITAVGNHDDASLAGLSGYFRITDSIRFLHALTRNGHGFVDALSDYARHVPVRAVRLEDWLDFGHVQTYFRSRHALLSARHFNSLQLEGGCVVKTSADHFKMQAESDWLSRLPPPMRLYAAQLVHRATETGDGRTRYGTEYHHFPTLAEIALSRLGQTGWGHIADALDDFLQDARGEDGRDNEGENAKAYRVLTTEKLDARIAAAPDGFPDLDRALVVNGRRCPPGREIIARLAQTVAASAPMPSAVMHGDFCFSNILYDSRAQRIKLIDPRGYVRDGRPQLGGDTRYDLAKLAHSVIGGYDQIIADNFVYERDGDRIDLAVGAPLVPIAEAFRKRRFAGRSLFDADIIAGMVGLFLSMIPLHADHPRRQRAFYANALDLYMNHAGEPA